MAVSGGDIRGGQGRGRRGGVGGRAGGLPVGRRRARGAGRRRLRVRHARHRAHAADAGALPTDAAARYLLVTDFERQCSDLEAMN